MPNPLLLQPICRLNSFCVCSGTAAVRVPLQFRKEWIPLPRSLAQSSSNGHLALRLRVRSHSSPRSKVRVPVVRVVFPLAGGYMDGLRFYPKHCCPPPPPPPLLLLLLLLLLIPPPLAGLVQATCWVSHCRGRPTKYCASTRLSRRESVLRARSRCNPAPPLFLTGSSWPGNNHRGNLLSKPQSVSALSLTFASRVSHALQTCGEERGQHADQQVASPPTPAPACALPAHSLTSSIASGDDVDVGAAMHIGFGLPLAPQQL